MDNNKKGLRKVLYIYIAIMLALLFFSKTIYNFSLPRVSVVEPARGSLTKSIESSGIINFSETIDIYAGSGGLIENMLINEGDLVNVDTIAAILKPEAGVDEEQAAALGFTIERLNNQIKELNLNKSSIERQLQDISAQGAGGLFSYQNAVEDAKIELGRRETDLGEARAQIGKAFNNYGHKQAIDDAKRDLERKELELKDAEAALLNISLENGGGFDDYDYKKNIEEASIALDRRKEELESAKSELRDAESGGAGSFDSYTYENGIDAARRAHNRSTEDYNDALSQYNNAVDEYNYLLGSGASGEEIDAALEAVNSSQGTLTSAERALSDASAALDRSINDMDKAEEDFYDSRDELINESVDGAKLKVEQAENAVEDAQRGYDNAVEDMEKARNDYIKESTEAKGEAINDAEDLVKAAQQAVSDAKFLYNKALLDHGHAAGEAALLAIDNLEMAEIAYAGAKLELERAEADLINETGSLAHKADDSRYSLNLELQQLNLQIDTANIGLREAMASNNEDTPAITAGCQGVVISVEKGKGQYVSAGEKIASVGVQGKSFVCEITCTKAEGRFIEIGGLAELSFGVVKAEAFINDIGLEGDMLKVSLACESNEFKGGEYVSVNINKTSEEYDLLLPNEAIFTDGASKFVWAIRSRQGSFGVEYYSEKVKVIVADSDSFYSAISRGMEYDRALVVSFSKELTQNGRVNRME